MKNLENKNADIVLEQNTVVFVKRVQEDPRKDYYLDLLYRAYFIDTQKDNRKIDETLLKYGLTRAEIPSLLNRIEPTYIATRQVRENIDKTLLA